MPDVIAQEPSEVSEAPTAVPESTAPADEAIKGEPESAAASQAQPRDEHGRFTEQQKKDLENADAPVVDAVPHEAAKKDDPPVLDPLNVQSDSIIAEAVRQTKEPFRFRAERAEHTLRDAEYYPVMGLFIPDPRIPDLKQLLAEGVTHQQTWRQTLDQVRTEANGRVEQAEARAKALNLAAVKLYDTLVGSGQFDEREVELLKRELALDLRSNGVTVQPRVEREPDERAAEIIQEQARDVLKDEVLTALAHNPKYAALAKQGEDDRKDLLGFFNDTLQAYFDEQEGQIVLDRHKVWAALDRELRKVSKISDAQTEATRKAEALRKAAEQNAARNAKPNIPPAVPTKGSPSPSDGRREYKTREEWQREMGLM